MPIWCQECIKKDCPVKLYYGHPAAPAAILEIIKGIPAKEEKGVTR